MTTTTFKGQQFTIETEIPVTPLLAAEGITCQQVIVGARGKTRLLQTFSNGVRRTISTTAKVETEYPLAA